jgi:pSer/pThr/pTyr-binding forkhead associated (FHA) protein
VPECPNCGSASFRRTSLFESPTAGAHLEPIEEGEPNWLPELRGSIQEAGQYVAFDDGDETQLVRLSEGWTRVGRSAMADVRLDDATVSRRHALVVRQPDGGLRVLDDRSLNGVFVNGERVDWARLADGDELTIGRYRLHVIDTAAVPAG